MNEGSTITQPNMPESSLTKRQRNTMIWIALTVVGLILFMFVGVERGRQVTAVTEVVQENNRVEIERSQIIPPGLRAREYIAEIRAGGEPYPLANIFEKGSIFEEQGNLADAHLLYFFSAREDYIPAIMKMGEMADPTLFRAENSLLDQADSIQAYKWYKKAVALGHGPATDGVKNLKQWATEASIMGHPDARQLMLNFE
ncbi:MAG: hypothetical protein ACERLB_08890 [Gammaproteobacteria bacterium]